MGKIEGKKFQTFCVNRIRPLVRVAMQHKLNDQFRDKCDSSPKFDGRDSGEEKLKGVGRKIMVVVDSSVEAKGALQWALTHTVQTHDIIVLLYVAKLTTNQGNDEMSKQMYPKVYELFHSMKKTCQTRKPEVEVEVKMVEGKEKGPTIVEEARKQGVSLLVLGQKKRSTTWRLLWMWTGGKVAVGGGGVVEYCIQNAQCMALAVRRKSKKVGGYLITTKRHKDFWLLA